jgi:monoamine oxidase
MAVMSSGTRISRRRFVGGAAAGVAAAGVPAPSTARSRPKLIEATDVVVVGAGLAGLAAGRRLKQAGINFEIVEARDRVGGRLLNHGIGDGEIVEVGGQWIGPTQDKIADLAGDLGVKSFPTFNEGDYVDYRNGQRVVYPKDVPIPPGDPAAAADAAQAIVRLDEMANQVPLDKPWEAANAEEWDSQTMETWIQANVPTPSGKELVRLGIEAIFACQPRDVSLLHCLFYIHSGESIERLIAIAGGAQESRLVGGSQLIAIKLAKRLKPHVHLGTPVAKIKQTGRAVVVTGKSFSLRAKHVIVTIPPTLAGRIEYDPPLPALRDQLTQRMPMGSVIKVQAIYDEPFWRADGLTGFATSDEGPVKLSFDNSPPDGKPGVLMGFYEGQAARVFSTATKKERRKATLECFARYFGDAALNAEGYVERNWAEEPFTRGGYAGFMTTGVWLDYGAQLRAPVGRIHWAGTETAQVWNGYMDGAVESGYRAADEVADAL